ncbi:MAG: 3-phosphoserine/phosphohydroxythreonine transaminase [Candidatus Wallbacteria bacterium]|nr:3-phosphoserine/phosphohydroxythreonine transaminase [Candidatus Wallbacteria bacterium]
MFLQGGARTQFAMVPLNLLPDEKTADYIVTGEWAQYAYKELAKIGKKGNIAASSEADGFTHIPERSTWKLTNGAAYVHYTSNNTIYGTQFRELPDFGGSVAVCDMSSDFLSRPFDVTKFGVVYAGAQKNAGPAGATIVIIRKDLMEKPASKILPTMLNYKSIADKDSMLNTPPCYSIYICGLVFKWIENIGGLAKMDERNKKKAGFIYDAIDRSNGFYKGFAATRDRSLMNITFKLPSPELDEEFVKSAAAKDMIGLKGYRTVGGIRASVYNAHPLEGAEKLAQLMDEFCKSH